MIRTVIAVAALTFTYAVANPALAQDGSVGDQYTSCSEAPAAQLAACIVDQSSAGGDNGE